MPKMGTRWFSDLYARQDAKILWNDNSLATKLIIRSKATADTNHTFQVRSSGKLEWGSGTAAPDAKLERSDAAVLSATGHLGADTLGVGNAAAASILGTVTHKIQVFDKAGVSHGYIAVYDAIT